MANGDFCAKGPRARHLGNGPAGSRSGMAHQQCDGGGAHSQSAEDH